MIGPRTILQMLAEMHRLPRKGSREHKRRHRAFLIRRAQWDGRNNASLYRRARKVLPLP